MRKLLLFVFILAITAYSQTPPSGYTSTIHLSKWNDGATPGATAINNNWTIVDSAAKAINDTSNAIKTDFYLEHNYLGNHKSNVITWDNLYTVDKNAYIVQMSGNQNVGGTKTFTTGISFFGGANFLLPSNSGNNTWKNLSQVGNDSSGLVIFNYGTALKDTIASQRWVRSNPASNVVTTNTTQTITGSKTFSGTTSLSKTIYTKSDYDWGGVGAGTYDMSYDATYMRINNAAGGSLTISNITGGTVGSFVIIENASATLTFTFTDGTNFKLNATRIMGLNDVLTLLYNGSAWVEVSYSDN